ncbi:disulfide bond formation protein B [Cognatishimia sp. MH4019]|uniref:disulfide bond formation protein B n=1 Tax=Cognatishimia sp. MH4019 TaxID=2854030 RepID=UPI001CD22B13|nr:disulfide bond formation protein B [Cognatishimia sp. MH4019]
MTRNSLIYLAAGGSLALLMGAWAFQYIGGMAPCAMCYWQRWPHMAAVPIGILAVAASGMILPLLGALAAAASGGIGIFHTGVERGWWEGPSSCTSGDISGVSAEDLLDQIMTAPLVRCDEIAWEMLGLSMASWNAVASFALMALWLMAARASAR